MLSGIGSSTCFTMNKGKQQFFEIYFCSELTPAIATNHIEICVYQQLVRSLTSNQQEKVTLEKSAARQGSSTEKNGNIQFHLNTLNTLVPADEGRKPKQDRTMHMQFTPRLEATHKGTRKYCGSCFRHRELFCNTAAFELLKEEHICPSYMTLCWQDRQHNHQHRQCCETFPSPPPNGSIKSTTSQKRANYD